MLSRDPIGRRRPVKIARIAVLAGVLSAASLGFMAGDAAAYGQADGPIAQIEFSGNCNNPDFVLCYPPDQGGFGLGGIWLWIEIDGGAGATSGDADIAGSGCGHIRGVGGGAFSIRGEFDWWWSATPEGADVTFGTYSDADGYYNVELGPNDVFFVPGDDRSLPVPSGPRSGDGAAGRAVGPSRLVIRVGSVFRVAI
jgi:hypothetical protein